jgi:hypothetical protein
MYLSRFSGGLVWLASLGLCAQPALAARTDRVVVSAAAAIDYNRELPDRPGLRPETYTFMEGRFFAGGSRSQSLAQTTFHTIARTLAADLAKQNYLPAPDPLQADLLLMVHWGMTQVYEDPVDPIQATERLNAALADVRAAGEANELPYLGELNERLNEQALTEGQQLQSMRQNARLLGYNVELDKEGRHPFGSTSELTMRSELSEERYFIIVMAYDYRAIREKRPKEALWIARLSLPARGNNFIDALPALSRVGSDFFGQRRTSLQRVRTVIGSGRAETQIGELQVVEDPPPPKE